MGNGILGPVPPPPTDFMALVRQQGQENRRAANFELGANRPDEIGPNGSRTWSLRPGADPNNPKPGDYVATITQNPTDVATTGILANNRQQAGLMAGDALSRVRASLDKPFDANSVGPNIDLGAMGYNEDPSSARRRVEDAYYGSATRYLGDRYGTESAASRSRLANSGIHMGSEAYNRAIRTENQGRDQAYGQAADSAILAGNTLLSTDQQIKSQRLADAMSVRSQNLGEATLFRNAPLTEFGALSGAADTIENPTFQNYIGTGGVGADPVLDGGIATANQQQMQYQDAVGVNQQRRATRQADRNSMWSGIGDIAKIAAMVMLA